MGIVTFNVSVSVDGYMAGPDQSPEHPLGVGGEQLHGWVVVTRAFKEMHGGGEGGETGPDNDVAAEHLKGAGAVIMGRNMFGGGPGGWDESWQGWWGEDPPFHVPTFVLTHHPRASLELQGGTTFHFVTDGLDAALAQAREAAGDADVNISGGADTINQALRAGAVDGFGLHVVPLLLGSGARLFEGVDPRSYELVRTVASPRVAHLDFRA